MTLRQFRFATPLTVCAALSFVILARATSLTAQAAPSAMFRGGPDHLGVYASPAPTLNTVVWKFATAGRVLSSPAVAGTSVYFGSTDRALYAVNAADGTQRWKFPTKGPITSSPAVAGGLVYVASLDGRIYAVDDATGKEQWQFVTAGESRFIAPGIHGAIPKTEMMADPFDVFLSSPVVDGGVVYIGSGDHNVYALDAATGALKWKFATGNVVHASPAVVRGVVYIGSWDRNMYAIDAATGRERWRFTTGNDTTIYNQVGIPSSAAVANGVVYFGCRDGHFYAVDVESGKLKWADDNHGSWIVSSAAVSNGTVIFATSDGKRFKALDAATGVPKVDVAIKFASYSSAAIAGHTAYFGTIDGWLHAMDITTGAVIAEFATDGWKENSPKYMDDKGATKPGTLYEDPTYDSMIIGVRRTMTMGSVNSSPVVANGVVYFGSADGQVYALR